MSHALCVCACVYMCTCACVCVRTCVCMCVHVCVYVCVCACGLFALKFMISYHVLGCTCEYTMAGPGEPLRPLRPWPDQSFVSQLGNCQLELKLTLAVRNLLLVAKEIMN